MREAISRISGSAHALGGDRGRPHPDAGGDHGLLGVERDGVLVQRDPAGVATHLRVTTSDAHSPKVDESQVGVGAPGDRAHALVGQSGDQCLSVLDDLARVGLVGRLHRLLQRDRLRRDDVHQWATLQEREDRLVDSVGQLLLAQDHAAPRPTQHLVGGERHDVGVRNRRRDRLTGDQSDEVRRIHHQPGADLVGDRPERREVDEAGVRGGAGDDHLGPVLQGLRAHMVVVDRLGALDDPVGDRLEPLAREVHRRTVREVSAVLEVHGEDGVARLEQRRVDGEVRGGTGVRLQVRVLGTEQLLRARDADLLGSVDVRAAAVVALVRVALGVLVRQRRSGGCQHRRRCEVLAGDQLQSAPQPVELIQDHCGDLGVLASATGRSPVPSRACTHGGSCVVEVAGGWRSSLHPSEAARQAGQLSARQASRSRLLADGRR